MLITTTKEVVKITREQDVVPFRNMVKDFAVKIKMGLVNQTKLITAASEIARNMLKYANGGSATIETVSMGKNIGIRLTFVDQGPGIADIDLAMQDGYSTGRSLGLGLPGTKRLVNMFEVKSEVNVGTTVMIVKWVNG